MRLTIKDMHKRLALVRTSCDDADIIIKKSFIAKFNTNCDEKEYWDWHRAAMAILPFDEKVLHGIPQKWERAMNYLHLKRQATGRDSGA